MNVAIIPARSGSKRIPRKNVKAFRGKPMIAWSIEAARKSNCFSRIVVSTDSDEIAAVAREWGAETPFTRPRSLADDHTGTQAVIAHAVQALELVEDSPVCCLYATAPLVQPKDLYTGLQKLRDTNAAYVFTVTNYPFPIQRAIRITPDNRVEMLQPEQFHTRSQDLEPAWHDAGQFYWAKAATWLKTAPIFTKASVPLPLPRWRVQDIDTPEDWTLAEFMHEALMREASDR